MTLLEVIVATALFAIASVAAAHLMVWAARALWSSGSETVSVAAAQEKVEELQSAAWHFDADGRRVSGPELAASPVNALYESVDGHVDYLDERGQPVGAGPAVPESAAYMRRWAVRPLTSAPDDTVVIQVLVVPLANGERASGASATGQGSGESLITTARTRMRR